MIEEKIDAGISGVSFAELDLAPEVLHAVLDAGYTHPTPIQQQAIPLALEGRDLIGLAQTGTGKSAGFTLPIVLNLISAPITGG
jgi:ATP-dependent RNA helicase RhlE